METKLIATHLQLLHGDTVLVNGRCWEDAKSFVVNLGQDCENVVLHFNPRFNYRTDVNVIVCNFKKLGKWGKEERLNFFPFEQGGKVKVRTWQKWGGWVSLQVLVPLWWRSAGGL
ncbi:16 kDa beta-galactoside-binding lectin-like [Podarcis muralis]